MLYISPENEYPRYYGDIQLAHKGWKLGDPLPTGWHEVTELPRPEIADDETVEEGFPVLVDGVYTQNLTARKLTSEELAIKQAPATAKAKLIALGLTEVEIEALVAGMVR